MEDAISAFECRMGVPESWRSAWNPIRNAGAITPSMGEGNLLRPTGRLVNIFTAAADGDIERARESMREITNLVGSGSVHVPPIRAPLEDAIRAHQMIETSATTRTQSRGPRRLSRVRSLIVSAANRHTQAKTGIRAVENFLRITRKIAEFVPINSIRMLAIYSSRIKQRSRRASE